MITSKMTRQDFIKFLAGLLAAPFVPVFHKIFHPAHTRSSPHRPARFYKKADDLAG